MLKAGTGRRDISPLKPMFLWGYPHVERMSTGIHDPLYATALCLDDGKNKTVAVSADVLYAGAPLVAECRRRIEARTGIPPQHVMISATHTHSGPVTVTVLAMSNDPVVPGPDSDYLELLTEGITEAACEAVQSTEPAEMAVTSAEIDGVGCNRLDPNGPRDAEAGLVVIRRAGDRRLLCVQMVYAMHPTILHEDSTLVSSDFPGLTRRYIEESFPGCRVVYHNGFCGNLSPRYHVKAQTFAEAGRFGVRLGRFIKSAAGKLGDSDYSNEARVYGQQALVQLVPRTFPLLEEAEQALQNARSEYERLKREDAGHGPVRTAECVVFGAEEVVTLARAQADGSLAQVRDSHICAEVQVLRAGDVFIAGLPGEWFVEYSLEIKQRAGERVFAASLTNGELQGYITTLGATGYEAGLSLFKPESGERMIQALLDLIEACPDGE